MTDYIVNYIQCISHTIHKKDNEILNLSQKHQQQPNNG